MITGYNTDVRHGDVVFHVQTEDKGSSNPFIESLVYVGGQVLASKRASYAELLTGGRDEKEIVALMDHQHRTMIAAIRHGKFDAKLAAILPPQPKTSAQPVLDPLAAPAGTPPAVPPAIHSAAAAPAPPAPAAPAAVVAAPPPAPMVPVGRAVRAPTSAMPTVAKAPAPERTLDQVILEYLTNEADQEQLVLLLDGEPELGLGRWAALELRATSSKSGQPIAGAQVSVRMISTVAEPRVLAHGRTDEQGALPLAFEIPALDRGTAALIITAVSRIGRAELKHLL